MHIAGYVVGLGFCLLPVIKSIRPIRLVRIQADLPATVNTGFPALVNDPGYVWSCISPCRARRANCHEPANLAARIALGSAASSGPSIECSDE